MIPLSFSSVIAHIMTPIGWLMWIVVMRIHTVHRLYCQYLEGISRKRSNLGWQWDPCPLDRESRLLCKSDAQNTLIVRWSMSNEDFAYCNKYTESVSPCGQGGAMEREYQWQKSLEIMNRFSGSATYGANRRPYSLSFSGFVAPTIIGTSLGIGERLVIRYTKRGRTRKESYRCMGGAFPENVQLHLRPATW